MEEENADFAFEAEEPLNQPPFIIHIKKSYMEEYSIIPNFEYRHHFTESTPESFECNSDRVSREHQFSYRVPEPHRKIMTLTTDTNKQFANMPPITHLPRLSVLLPDMFTDEVGSVDIGSHFNMLTNSFHANHLQNNQLMETAINKPVAEIHHNNSCHQVPVLVSPAKGTGTRCKFSDSTVPDCIGLQSAGILHNSSSMNRTLADKLVMSKNSKPISQRKFIKQNIKGLSPWPEMPINTDVVSISQEISTTQELEFHSSGENKTFDSDVNSAILKKFSGDNMMDLNARDILLDAVSNITTVSEMGLLINSNCSQVESTSSVSLPPSSWINSTGSNPLQIPWPEIVKEITCDAGCSLTAKPIDFPVDYVGQVDLSDWSQNTNYFRSLVSSQPGKLSSEEGIKSVLEEAQIVPQSFQESLPECNEEFHQCLDVIEEVVLMSDKSEPETGILPDHIDDPLSILEIHNYCQSFGPLVVVPRSSSPWSMDQFNASIAELDQHFSPIYTASPKDEKTLENVVLLENEHEKDGNLSKFVEESNKDMDSVDREDATTETCCDVVDSDQEMSEPKDDSQICPGEVHQESISESKNTDYAIAEEQTVPNSCILTRSVPYGNIFTHTLEFEEFYAGSSMKKRAKTSRVDGRNHRPLRIGLSKKRRVRPLHDLKTFKKE